MVIHLLARRAGIERERTVSRQALATGFGREEVT